jgi:hypothetical protein
MLSRDLSRDRSRDGIHTTHLEFHSERSLADGWGADWAREASGSRSEDELPQRQSGDWVGERPSRRVARKTRAAKGEKLRLVVSDIELGEDGASPFEIVDTLSWRQPTARSGYTAHREQFV